MSKQNLSQIEHALHKIAETIVHEIDSLYELDFISGTYHAVKSSLLFQSVFGTEGKCDSFISRVLSDNPFSPASDLYKDFCTDPGSMGRAYMRYIDLNSENGNSSILFMYYRVSDETAFAFFCPSNVSTPPEEKESVKKDTLIESYLYSMHVDLDLDECSDLYVSGVQSPNPEQRDIKFSYSGWRDKLLSCITDEHKKTFLANTEQKTLRQKLFKKSRYSFAIRMHEPNGSDKWTMHSFIRVHNQENDHLSAIYTVQDIDEEIKAIVPLPQQCNDSAKRSSDDPKKRNLNISSTLSKDIRLFSPFANLILEHVVADIQNNYMNKISLKHLAGKYYINAAYLGQLFKQKYGVTFHEYLSKVRMENAAGLLLTTNYAIHQVAEKCGMLNPSYFHRQFRKYFNCTPEEYRAANKKI